MSKNLPTVLLILDGWGIGTDNSLNAISAAHTPNWDQLIANHPNCELAASGTTVGLPDQQPGNSEVGHLHIGAGRTIPQDLVRINAALQDPHAVHCIQILELFQSFYNKGITLNLFGLYSNGGVHSHLQHWHKLISFAKTAGCKTQLHLFLDGRDTPPKSALKQIQNLEDFIADIPNIKLSTIAGRFYAMDRDHRWERTALAYETMMQPTPTFDTATQAIQSAYTKNLTDEFIHPTALYGAAPIQVDDACLCLNFRADRAHQIMQAFGQEDFSAFTRKQPHITNLYSLTDYPHAPTLTKAIFQASVVKNTLGDVIASLKLKQLRIAETEKYAHVTFFIDGGDTKQIENCKTHMIASPKVATYDQAPGMSTEPIINYIIKMLEKNTYDFIIANIASADMVGHTGKLAPTIQAIEIIDVQLGRLIEAVKQQKAQLIITADHGNAEAMGTESNPITSHSNNPVPLVILNSEKNFKLKNGNLADVAPTTLALIDQPIPAEWTGQSLLVVE